MRHYLIVGIMGAMVAGVTLPALAADQALQARPTSIVASPSTVEGSVIGVDAKMNRLKIAAADGKTTWTFALDPKTTTVWSADGQRGVLAILNVGQRVQVSYLSNKEGKQVAQSVKVQGAASTGAMAPAAASASTSAASTTQ